MRFPVFGKPKFPRAEMEKVAAQELATALEAVPQPPDPSFATWPVAGGWQEVAQEMRPQAVPAASEAAPVPSEAVPVAGESPAYNS